MIIEGDENGDFLESQAGRDLLQEHHRRLTLAYGKFRIDLGGGTTHTTTEMTTERMRLSQPT